MIHDIFNCIGRTSAQWVPLINPSVPQRTVVAKYINGKPDDDDKMKSEQKNLDIVGNKRSKNLQI